MNIEECIEQLKDLRLHCLSIGYEFDKDAEAIEWILTAYEKEKEIVDKINKLNIPVDTLIAEFERLEDLEDDLTTVYLNGVYDGEKKVQDKIKAKIEEYEEKIRRLKKKSVWEEPYDTEKYVRYTNYISVLQSLLEKE